MDFETIVPIINMLPPQAQIVALNALGLLCMAWLSLLGGRALLLSIMGPPQATDSERKTAIYHAFKWLDLFTPAQLRALLEISRKEKVIRTLVLSVPPKVASVPPAPWAEPVPEEPATTRETPTSKRSV